MLDTVQNYSFDGQNVSTDPTLNAASSDETRIAAPNFAPGTTNTPIDGPNPRDVSNVVVAGNGTLEGAPYSGMLYAWGQFIDHDLDLTRNDGVNHIDITIPANDPTFTPGSVMPLTRATVDPANGQAVNAITGWLDASNVYGSDAATAASLRTADGHMKTSDGNNLPIVNGQYVAGDARAAENPDLTALQTLMVREHNHWVDQLAGQHPGWTGDQLYAMARAIVTAEIQNITYNEFLPLVLGPWAPGSYQGYDSNVDPRITEEFAGSAYRFGHTIVSEAIAATANDGTEMSAYSLADGFFQPPAAFAATGADGLLRHLTGDISQKYDVHIVDSLRDLLVDPPDGQDLAAINIQRGRDLGLGTLNQTRAALGLSDYTSFDQITSDPAVAANLSAVYGGDVNKVELWIGGLAEDPAPGALVGPTFQAIIARQFTALRDGDALWFQNQGFDQATLDQIQNTSLSDLIMRNTDTTVAQPDAFLYTERRASDVAPTSNDAPQLVMGIADDGAAIAGGPMDDTIVAGTGLNQILTGGVGNDTFVFLGSGHTDMVTDFTPGTDKLDFANTTTGADLQGMTVGTGGDGWAVMQYDGNAITLAGVRPDQMTAGSYLLDHKSVTWSEGMQPVAGA
jgi:peroxidase